MYGLSCTVYEETVMKRNEQKRIIVLSCLIIFFGVMLLSATVDILCQRAADGEDRKLSFVTECGKESPAISYVTEDYEDDGTVVRSGERGSGKMTFTCNVDWGEEVIPDLLEIFREKNVRITFFVTGSWASKNTELLRRMYLAGHEIGSHGYGHKMSSQISQDELKSEIEKTENAIRSAIGVLPGYFAPPSGDFSGKTVEFCRQHGYRLILWSADTIDWRDGSTADVIRQRILEKELDGAIVLMHPKEETAKALPGLIDEIRQRGIEPVKLSQLLGEEEA